MLQASPKDRRAIFEEAAGISRFKAKKVETERRLARVDQNMLRLSDIVDEVESRLRSVRSQASKARRYKEYSDRLQQLRTQVGMTDWRKLSEQLAQTEGELAGHRDDIQQREAECGELDVEVVAAEAALVEVDQTLRQTEGEIATNREQIAALQSTVEHGRTRGLEIEDELARCRRQLAAMGHRAGNLDEQLRETEEEVEAASEEYGRLCRRVDEASEESSRLGEALHTAQDGLAEMRERRMGLLQTGAELSSELSGARSQLAGATATLDRLQEQGQRAAADLEQNGQQLGEAESQLRGLEANLHEQDRQVSGAEEDLERARRRLERHKTALANLSSEKVRLDERHAVLTDLVERNEGVQAGVQQVLERAEDESDGPYGDVCGMLADLMDVHVESAPVVEAALGELTQAVVVRGDALLRQFRDPLRRPSGRVTLLPLEDAPLRIEAAWSSLEQQSGVIGRADRFVATDLIYAPLVRRLLGTTWVVESLEVADRLSELAGEQLRFVTLDGAVLETDGTIVFGAAQQTTGLIARRSQLRDLQVRLGEIDGEIERTGKQAATSQSEIDELAQQARQLAALRRELADELSQARAQVQALSRQQQSLEQRCDAAEAESNAATQARQQAAGQIVQLEQQQQSGEQAAAALHEEIEHAAAQLRTLEAQHKACDLRATTAKVEAAKSEQRLDALRARLRQTQRDRHERQRALDELHQQIARAKMRSSEGELDILGCTSAMSELYLQRQSLGEQLELERVRRTGIQQARGELTQQIEGRRREIHRLEDKCHRLDLAAEQARSERDHLAQRLRDDYGIELAAMQTEETDEEVHEREAVGEEIDDLRRKINNIGAVNLEALNEIEQLEERFNTLAGQFNDLKDSKAALEKIIHRINADSRRLFAETLEAIRGNFQALYRKLFGGGHADIVLEEGVDILEAGIEIVANPPGKPAFNNSLLSGGEQGLTAVSLLLQRSSNIAPARSVCWTKSMPRWTKATSGDSLTCSRNFSIGRNLSSSRTRKKR